MMIRVLKTVQCAWLLQGAFDDVSKENYVIAKNRLDKILRYSRYVGDTTDLGIQTRILRLLVDYELDGTINIGTLIYDIRHTSAFNDDEKALLLKYVLTIIYLGFHKSRADALQTARNLKFDRDKVNPMLLRRYEGCERILSNPGDFLASP
jgi:hypothetical protein